MSSRFGMFLGHISASVLYAARWWFLMAFSIRQHHRIAGRWSDRGGGAGGGAFPRFGGFWADPVVHPFAPMKRARPRAMRSKMCRRPRPRPAQGLASASSAADGRARGTEPGAVVEELAAAGGGAGAADVECGAGGEDGGEKRRNAAASVTGGDTMLAIPWIDMPG